MADGLVGGVLPNLVLYFPVLLPANASGSRYWTMVATPVPDMQGSREQAVWFRFQQVQCAGEAHAPPCELHGDAQYWDSFWFARAPDNRTDLTGPVHPSAASGFYANLLAVRRYWKAELAAEGMMALSLPSPPSTNGTWLQLQATHAVVRAMIGRSDTWHPRYGVTPGYGQTMQDGFQDVFTATTTAALEMGAMAWARGLIDNQFRFYVRDDGMIYCSRCSSNCRLLSSRGGLTIGSFCDRSRRGTGAVGAHAHSPGSVPRIQWRRQRLLAPALCEGTCGGRVAAASAVAVVGASRGRSAPRDPARRRRGRQLQ